MIKSMNKLVILAGVVAGMAVVGCVKEKDVFEPGSAIRFSASSSSLETRTVYDPSGATEGKHYINWVTGDGMTILMTPPSPGTASNRNYKVKTVSSVTDDPNSDSKATVEPDGGSALTWSYEGTYTFYAMYPAAEDSSNPLKGTIPSTQTASTSLPFGYMYADPVQKPVEARKTVTDINLYFRPYFTAYQFTLVNTGNEDITLYSFELTSPTNALNGDIEYTPGSSPAISHKVGTNVTASDRTITVSGITIPKNDSFVFIITSLPNPHTSLTVKIKKDQNGDPKTLTMNESFAAQMKHNITLTLPDFTNYEYTFEVVSPTDLTYEAGKSITASVTSYKNVVGSSTKELVEWEVAGYYSSEEDALSTAIADNNNTPSWLTSGLSYDSSTTPGQAQSLSLVHSAITIPSGSGTTISSDIQNSINQSIKSVECGSPANPINLANPTNTGSNPSTYIAESANSYIVNHPGWYKIPVVMGNGIKLNAINGVAGTYCGTSGTGTELFDDYGSNHISSPILSEFSTASIVWQAGTGTVVEIPASNYKISPASGGPSVYWLKFHVTAEGQGNAVIAVKDNNGTIMWSYHIWVTHYVPHIKDVSITNSKSITYNVMPFTLGWITESGAGTKYDGTSVYVRIRQKGSSPKAPLVMKLACPDIYTFSDQPTGKNPFYQWGRKDPFPPNGVVTTENMHVAHNGVYGVDNLYYRAITNPDTYFYRHNGGYLYTWLYLNSYSYYNLWNAGNSSVSENDDPVYKTIYDPSPAGYSLPASRAFAGVTMTRFIGAAGYLNYNGTGKAVGIEQDKNILTYDNTPNDGRCFLWTAIANTSNGRCYYLIPGSNASFGSTSSNHSSIRGYSVLPMQNSN